MAGRRRTGHIRIVADGDLVDEQDRRWERMRGESYYMTPGEVAAVDSQVTRYLTAGGYGTSVVVVSRAEFQAAVVSAFEHRVTALRSSRGDGGLALLVDTSDC